MKEEQSCGNKMTLKVCSYHEQLQNSLKKGQRILAADDTIEIRLHIEPVNLRDENGIGLDTDLPRRYPRWLSLCKTTRSKVFNWFECTWDLFLTLVLIGILDTLMWLKGGRWNPDVKNYSWNHCPTRKWNIHLSSSDNKEARHQFSSWIPFSKKEKKIEKKLDGWNFTCSQKFWPQDSEWCCWSLSMVHVSLSSCKCSAKMLRATELLLTCLASWSKYWFATIQITSKSLHT